MVVLDASAYITVWSAASNRAPVRSRDFLAYPPNPMATVIAAAVTVFMAKAESWVSSKCAQATKTKQTVNSLRSSAPRNTRTYRNARTSQYVPIRL